jgi:hypothetical protein
MRQRPPSSVIFSEAMRLIDAKPAKIVDARQIDTFKSIVKELDIFQIDTDDIDPQRIDEALPLIRLHFKKRLLMMLDDSKSIKVNATKLNFSNTYRGLAEKNYLVFNRPESLEHFIIVMSKLKLQFTNARFYSRQGEQFLPALNKIKQPAIELPSELAQKLLYRDEKSVCVFRLEGKTTKGPQGMQDIVNYLLFLETSDRLKNKIR